MTERQRDDNLHFFTFRCNIFITQLEGSAADAVVATIGFASITCILNFPLHIFHPLTISIARIRFTFYLCGCCCYCFLYMFFFLLLLLRRYSFCRTAAATFAASRVRRACNNNNEKCRLNCALGAEEKK